MMLQTGIRHRSKSWGSRDSLLCICPRLQASRAVYTFRWMILSSLQLNSLKLFVCGLKRSASWKTDQGSVDLESILNGLLAACIKLEFNYLELTNNLGAVRETELSPRNYVYIQQIRLQRKHNADK